VTSAPLVSCVLPVFNGERFVAESLESVFQQSYSPIEIVVVNDGSTDGTKAVLDQYGSRIKVIDQANAGVTAARIRGIAASSGALIAFLDADDLWLPEKTKMQVEHLAAHPEAGICTCLIENFWEEDLAEEAERLRGSKFDGSRMATLQGIVLRPDVLERLGGLSPEIEHHHAVDLLLRARDEGIAIEHVDRVLVRRRIHRDNLSRTRGERGTADLLRLAEGAIARRRATDVKH